MPQNWHRWIRWIYTIIIGCLTLGITFASTVFSVTLEVTSEEFDVSHEVMILGISLFVLVSP